MRFDIITIFPEFFLTLDVSLLGKAKQSGALQLGVHNLRDWASGKHLTVDDTPSGGGAGMVMKADVWGKAIDDVLVEGGTLAIPTPSGKPLTQEDLNRLSSRSQIVVACGRYEGIDARVAEHYESAGVEVFQYSLGDYVLNGGEVAALALVEGVGRLMEGVVGNAESLVEESFSGDGLLEYPVYTTPRQWRGLDIPSVLLSGDHGKIARWRRRQSLKKTAKQRPDLLFAQSETTPVLDRDDRETLAGTGWNVRDPDTPLVFGVVTDSLGEVAALAAKTFPLACPAGTKQSEIDDFIKSHLNPDSLEKLRSAGARISTVKPGAGQAPIAYSLVEPKVPEDFSERFPSACYVSKLYVSEEWHGTGLAGALLEHALQDAVEQWDSPSALLGTNRGNKRAIRFYRRHGFAKAGTRTFNVGGREHHDFVFVRDLTLDPPR